MRWTSGLKLPGRGDAGRPEGRSVHVATEHMKAVEVRDDAVERLNGSRRLAMVTPQKQRNGKKRKKNFKVNM